MTDRMTPQAIHELKEADAELFARLDGILVEESPMHPFGCATWAEETQTAIDMAKDRMSALIADYERAMGLLRYAANTIETMRPSFAQAKDEGHAYHDQVLHEIRQALTQGESS